MPGRDGTGPLGKGPMTGRAAGFCTGLAGSGYANGVGRCGGFGYGRAYGRRWDERGYRGYKFDDYSSFPAAAMTDSEKEAMLRVQEKQMEMQLEQIRKRLGSFEKRNQ